MPLEARSYDADCTPAERVLLLDRVSTQGPRLICIKELEVATAWSIKFMGKKIHELAAERDRFCLLFDITETTPPNAVLRAALREVLAPLLDQGLQSAAVFTGRNFLINVAAKFVWGGAGLRDFSVHTTRAEAEAALQMYL
jgi:hypothetical protein